MGYSIAVPIAIGIALFITQYAPARLSRPVAYVIDLLAAIPSIIYGIWGIAVLAPKLSPVQNWLGDALGWIPIFAGRDAAVAATHSRRQLPVHLPCAEDHVRAIACPRIVLHGCRPS